ncbi:zinc-dependent alcohol dehydrogenase family protein [Jiella pacifica]|uniref:Alcohol dehydrogenase catalytic domain-containing protein n=1 Tax=Jiella pacifica TaxID=2696469 RepID=A0A6N9SXT0_9HYPH|nr:zinc-dependent alcohol dehydrogenase family protein [Jiella pacifica]NDW03112.1 alcohol dehydrogenase catalytic domain-containing protein [Jiella pacifica]
MTTIRAAVLNASPVAAPYAETRPLAIETLELEAPGRGEALVRIKAAGLCHSDLSVVNGARPRPVPMALGHEAAGIVEALGDGVDDLAVGDHVVMVFVPSCGHCAPCAEGRPALCEPGAAANGAGTLLGGAIRLSYRGERVHHHIGVSAFAEAAVVSRHSLVKIDRDLPFEHAALFGCAVLTGVGAVVNTAAVRAGQSVAIVGLGGVGLAALLGARAAGAATIVAVDPLAEKRTLALELGATVAIDPRAEGAEAEVKALTRGGVDAAVELAGAVPALDFAYRITRRGGLTVTGGLAAPNERFAIPPISLVAEERTLKGSYIGSCVPTRDIPRYVAMFRAGLLPVDRLLTSTGGLDDINAALDALAEGRTVRHVITM